MDFGKLATDEMINKTIAALQINGMDAEVVTSGEEAKQKVLSLIPQSAEVMNMTSITTHTIGLDKELTESGKYNAVRTELNKMNRKTQSREMQRLGAAPEYATGSVHALTENGQLMIASNTGSQLAAESYGAGKVIYVVGAQKIVKDIDEGMKRIHDYVLPQESVRARKAYGLPEDWHSNISKLLIINKEVHPHRIHVIIVKEKLGF